MLVDAAAQRGQITRYPAPFIAFTVAFGGRVIVLVILVVRL
jgi:hypothetical protein